MTLFAFIASETARNLLLVLVGGCYLGYHFFHLWRWWREKAILRRKTIAPCVPKTDSEGKVERGVAAVPQSANCEAALSPDCGGQRTVRPTVSIAPPPIQPANKPTSQQSSALSGEELYAEARAMPHQLIPDYEHDGEYLKLLAKSAELGYPRAMAKLGDYAMRRGWTVEAYYWLWRAKKGGMENLERMLLQVRSAWANEGFRRESGNEYECFSHEQGNIGYALLCVDARHNANAAKVLLAECGL